MSLWYELIFYSMDDPRVFDSIEEVKNHVNQISESAGFKMYFKGLNQTTGKGKFMCNKQGTYSSKSNGIRKNTSSIKTGCKFVMYVYRKLFVDDQGRITERFTLTTGQTF